MKVLMIASPSGGSAKTTTAVRLGVEFNRLGIRTGVIDLSPYPTANMIAPPELTVVQGRSANTAVAARCVLKPFEDQWKLAIVDTGRLDDPVLDFYSPLVDAVLLTTRPDPFSLRSLPSVSQPLQRLRSSQPQQKFLGFLPVLTSFDGGFSVMPLRQAAGKYMINHPIPASAWEWKRAHHSILLDDRAGDAPLDSLLDQDPVETATRDLAVTVLRELEVSIPREDTVAPAPPPKEVGALTKLWRLATQSFVPRARVEGKP